MRTAMVAVILLLSALLAGCNRPLASEPPAPKQQSQQQQSQQKGLTPIPDEELRAVSAIKPGTRIDVDAEAEEPAPNQMQTAAEPQQESPNGKPR